MEYHINFFNEYIEILKEYREKHTGEIWFRGQRNRKWKLEPNLYRNKVLDVPKNEIAKLNYKTPDFIKEFDKFVERVKKDNLFDIEGLNRFQIMFLGQHYGLLTPVLDWTTDPLAAMFFALDGYEYEEGNYPVIYMLRPGFCNENSDKVWAKDSSRISEPICIDGEEMDKYFETWIEDLKNPVLPVPVALCSKREYSFRISRQSGNFTLHSPIQPLNYRWNDITIEGQRIVDRFTINPKAIKEIETCLECLNITSSTLYKVDNEKLDTECKRLREESINEFQNGGHL